MSAEHIQLTDSLVAYIRSVSSPEPAYLKRVRDETAQDPLARMQITPEQGHVMGMLVRMLNARRCIEVGVFTGYSSLCVAAALPEDGQLICCDVSETWTVVARRYWQEAGLEKRIDLRLAPAVETLDALLAAGDAGKFDFVFIDADKANYTHYYDRAYQLVRRGGVIATDNVLWHGKVIDPAANDVDTVAIRAYNAKLCDDQRVHVCMIPMGDGLTLAIKK